VSNFLVFEKVTKVKANSVGNRIFKFELNPPGHLTNVENSLHVHNLHNWPQTVKNRDKSLQPGDFTLVSFVQEHEKEEVLLFNPTCESLVNSRD